ncbi:MAG TPA: HEAT repeat domain-containing protein [Anaerolineae bacterium]
MPLFGPNLAAMKEKGDLAGLVLALKNKDARARGQAVQALGELRAKSAVPAIAEFLLAPDRSIAEQVTAAEALGSIQDEAAIDPLTQAFAASQVRERGDINATIDAADLKYSTNYYVNRIAADESMLRSATAIALGRIGGERAARALVEMLAAEAGQMADSVKSTVRKAFAEVLEREGERLIPLACEELKHNSTDVREWAAHCLGNLGGEAAINPLLAAACDEQEDFAVREAALRGLGNMGDRRAIPYLEDLLNVENRSITRDAQAALIGIRQRHPLPQPEN